MLSTEPSSGARSPEEGENLPTEAHLKVLMRVLIASFALATALNLASGLVPSAIVTATLGAASVALRLYWKHRPETPRRRVGQGALVIAMVAILAVTHFEGATRFPNLMYLAPFQAMHTLLFGAKSSPRWLLFSFVSGALLLVVDVQLGRSQADHAITYFFSFVLAALMSHGIGVAAARVAAEAVAEARRATNEARANAEQLERANAELETALRAKSDFLSSMSHELRTPLHAIVGFTDLLLDTRLSDEQRSHVQTVSLAGKGLLTVVNDVLDLARIEAGKLDLRPAALDATEQARQIVQVLSVTAQQKGLSLSVVNGGHLPHVLADEARLRQVLLNLVGNAIKFTDHGSVTIRVTRSPRDETRERVEIIDTGIGIDEEARARLFSPFEQLESGQVRRHGGSGLGLAISRKLVEAMGGAIGVDSAPGTGSTFWFELPRASSPAPSPTERRLATATATSTLRVLVVEDNPVNRRLITRQLTPFGCDVTVVEGGAQALDELAKQAFDLVLMDVQMPEMDGLEATRRIRAFEASQGTPRTRVIALSASVLEEDLARCRDAGMDGHLAKPATRDDLAALLARSPAARP